MKSRSPHPSHLDVVILGAGSAGLSLALSLLDQGYRVQVLDRRPAKPWSAPPEFDTRVYALNTQSHDFLERLGVWKYLDPSRIGIIKEIQVTGDDESQLHLGDRKGDLAHVVEDGALQAALYRVLHERHGQGWFLVDEATEFVPSPKAATLNLRSGQTLTASLIVGADGAHSWLRSALGWAAHRTDYQQLGVVAHFACAQPHDEIARQWFIEGEIIALLPLGGNHVSLVWSAHTPHAEALIAHQKEPLVEALRERIGEPLGPMQQVSTAHGFPLALVKVPKIAGQRCALIGDAAHGVHPLAGQGLNLGFADADCLAQVIAHRGAGPDMGDESVLRRYARRRALPITLMQTVTDGLHSLFSQNTPLSRPLRQLGLNAVNRLTPLKSLLVCAAAGSLLS